MENNVFTKKMKEATRKIHNISDALINAKLGLAMSNDHVWSEGLLVFYEIFKQLEEALDRSNNTLLKELDISGIRRAKAFEKDLNYYLGEQWKVGYEARPSVVEYQNYLTNLEHTNPILLCAYVYHLYMGLLAGGQILKKKRSAIMRITMSKVADSMEGLAVVTLDGAVYAYKKELSDAMNNIADKLDDDTKELLIEESKNVFLMNNKVVRSIRGTNEAVLNILFRMGLSVLIISIMIYYVLKYFAFII